MTAEQLIKKQLDHSGFQVEKVFEGLGEEFADKRAADKMMSPRETLEHLAECYVASQKSMAGEKHEWGSYKSQGGNLAELYTITKAERDRAVASILAGDIEKGAEAATDYLILHDAYHVGQMCTNRLSFDPEWNAYAIYGM